jgi:hypothetical protein
MRGSHQPGLQAVAVAPAAAVREKPAADALMRNVGKLIFGVSKLQYVKS